MASNPATSYWLVRRILDKLDTPNGFIPKHVGLVLQP